MKCALWSLSYSLGMESSKRELLGADDNIELTMRGMRVGNMSGCVLVVSAGRCVSFV